MASGQSTARDAFITLETSDTARAMRGDTNTSTLTRNAETPEATGYGSTDRKRIADGLRDWSFSATCFFNDTATTGIETIMDSILGQQTVLVWGPAGSTGGNVKYTGSCIVSEYAIEAPVDGVVGLTFSLVASAGSMTHGTF